MWVAWVTATHGTGQQTTECRLVALIMAQLNSLTSTGSRQTGFRQSAFGGIFVLQDAPIRWDMRSSVIMPTNNTAHYLIVMQLPYEASSRAKPALASDTVNALLATSCLRKVTTATAPYQPELHTYRVMSMHISIAIPRWQGDWRCQRSARELHAVSHPGQTGCNDITVLSINLTCIVVRMGTQQSQRCSRQMRFSAMLTGRGVVDPTGEWRTNRDACYSGKAAIIL